MATEAWMLEKATIGEGDEVANSLADRINDIQAGITASGDFAVPAVDAIVNAIWGDVIGNKSDAASGGATASIVAIIKEILEESEEIDQHNHNQERWWGAVGAPDETNAIDANVDTPFAATSGNDDWGVAIPICGTGDDPVVGAQTEFDPHRILVTDLDDDTSPWRLRIIWGTTTSANAIAAGQWSEIMLMTNNIPGNQAGGIPIDVRMPPIPVGTKMWAQSWNDTNGEVLSFFWGAHGYPFVLTLS
jgi:hypothetical protein